MSALKHTPGPWEVFPPLVPGDYGVLSKCVNAGGNFYVAKLPNGAHAEAEANAHLIGAAPDLLEACLAAAGLIALEWPEDRTNQHSILAKCIAAIAKATNNQ